MHGQESGFCEGEKPFLPSLTCYVVREVSLLPPKSDVDTSEHIAMKLQFVFN